MKLKLKLCTLETYLTSDFWAWSRTSLHLSYLFVFILFCRKEEILEMSTWRNWIISVSDKSISFLPFFCFSWKLKNTSSCLCTKDFFSLYVLFSKCSPFGDTRGNIAPFNLLHVHTYAEIMIAKMKYSVENIMWSVLRKQNVLAEEVCGRGVRIEESSPSLPLLTLPL